MIWCCIFTRLWQCLVIYWILGYGAVNKRFILILIWFVWFKHGSEFFKQISFFPKISVRLKIIYSWCWMLNGRNEWIIVRRVASIGIFPDQIGKTHIFWYVLERLVLIFLIVVKNWLAILIIKICLSVIHSSERR